MSNFDNIENYLTDRLTGEEKSAFEHQLEADPALKSEVDMQRQIIEGIKQARVDELKAMLNQVPVSGGMWGGFSGGKVAATVLTAGLIITVIYFYLKPSGPMESVIDKPQTEDVVKEEVAGEEPDNKIEEPVLTEEKDKKEETEKTLKLKEDKPKKEVVSEEKPEPEKDRKISAVDPTEEIITEEKKETSTPSTGASTIKASTIEVVMDSSDKKYNFHYQFSDGKLHLFGSFDKNLYEINEVHGENHVLFFYFNDKYYLLNEKQYRVAPLTPVTDPTLLKKLAEYRTRN